MDLANDGDLRPLVRFFSRLEGIALRFELTRPAEVTPVGGRAADVARAYADRLRAIAEGTSASRAQQAEAVAGAVHARVLGLLEARAEELRRAFHEADPAARASMDNALPPSEKSRHWRIQLVSAARAVGFYTNLRGGTWWVRLHLVVFGQRMRYLVAVQKVGPGETGVLAVTAWAEAVEPPEPESDRPMVRSLLDLSPDDSVTLVYTDTANDRWNEVEELVERTLAAAVDQFARQLG